MSKLQQLNGKYWMCTLLGEQALLLEPEAEENPLQLIHQTSRMLSQTEIDGVIDFIPAYNSIAFIYNRIISDVEVEIKKIQKAVSVQPVAPVSKKAHVVPLCYELGLDWEAVEKLTSQKKEEVIQKHLDGKYEVAMMGFIPGFVYLQGLNDSIACPRKENPRTVVPAGSVGIGGDQAGIYSLESPGGWQVIGRTPVSFFNPKTNPPTQIQPGDQLVFKRISEAEFNEIKEALS